MASFRRLGRLLPQGDLPRGALTIVAGTGTAQLIVIASAPVLTRLYQPSDYGVYAVVAAVLGILVSFTCLRYEFAIPIPQDDVAAANLLGLSLVAAIGVSALVGVMLWVWGSSAGVVRRGQLGAVHHPYRLRPIGRWRYIGIDKLGDANEGFPWDCRESDDPEWKPRRCADRARHSGRGAASLVLGSVAGSFAGSSRLARSSWRLSGAAFRSVSWSGMAGMASRYRRFPFVSTRSGILGAVGTRAPLLLLVGLYGPYFGGQYALAERICYLPVTLVAFSVGQVFVAEGALRVREQTGTLLEFFLHTTWLLARLAIGPAVVAAIAAPMLSELVFGAEWRDTGWIVAILVPMFYVAFITTATGDILFVLERQGLHLAREILRFVLLGGAIALAARAGLSPLGAVAVLSAAGCATYAVYGLITWRAIVSYQPRTGDVGIVDASAEEELTEWPPL